MKQLLIPVCLLFLWACKTSEQQTSSSDSITVDSLTNVPSAIVSTEVEVAEAVDYAEAPRGENLEPERMETPEIPEDDWQSTAINPELEGVDTLYNVLARKGLVEPGSPTVTIITNNLLDLRNPDKASSLLAVFIEVATDEENTTVYDRTLAVFDSQRKLVTYRFLESDFQTTETDTRVVEVNSVSLSDGGGAIDLVYKSDGKFDVVSYGNLHRGYIYAFDNNRLLRIFEYQPMSYDFQGADGWISTTVTDEMGTENCLSEKMCEIVLTSKTLNESSDGPGESVPSTIARYAFNGQVYVRK